MAKSLHIISFDVPYPADYGGVIDVYYRIRALCELGIKVKLHCFDYGRGRPDQLAELADEVYYYKRSFSLFNHFDLLPFIVKSRQNKTLLKNLLKDEDPIWFEGIHTCGFLNNTAIKHRLKAVRLHNNETAYYSILARSEKNWIKKLYNRAEAFKLNLFEEKLNHANLLFTISSADHNYFQSKFKNTHYLAPFIKEYGSIGLSSGEDFSLYHGNLQVSENQEAAMFLLKVYAKLPYRLIIAGKNPSDYLKRKIAKLQNVSLVENPGHKEMHQLIIDARLNCLPTFQPTGVKLKLINALRIGKEVLVNSQMLCGTELDQFCKLANSKKEWRAMIKQIYASELSESEVEKRRTELDLLFNNKKNAMTLLELLAQAQ